MAYSALATCPSAQPYNEVMPYFHFYREPIQIICLGLVFTAFAIAHVVSIIYPPVNGKPQKETLQVAKICLGIMLAAALPFALYVFNEILIRVRD